MGKRLIQQRRGRFNGRYTVPSHRFRGKIKYQHDRKRQTGIIQDIIHDPGRTAPLAKVRLSNDKTQLIIAAEGAKIGDSVHFSDEKEAVRPGNIIPIGVINEGFPVYNIELKPGDGGKLVRAGGSSATIVAHESDKTVIRLPSGQFKTISSDCRATIGAVAGGGRKDKPYLKAGKKYIARRVQGKIHPVVRGVAMSPVDHPHGGGAHQHVGKPKTIRRGASPGRKVGSIAAKRTGRK
ncbi:MAG: 50S ribosomal protein L2 [Candidatus Thermoplasmatota archaeon]|nr:50S ribosomal protein L2 [Candidatus Thermoplasmatota archaeon]